MAARPGGILCAGNLVVDILVRPVDEIRWDASTWVEAMAQSIGGNGASTCYAAAKCGARVRLAGLVGSDAFAEYVLGVLGSVGVDLGWIGRSSKPTPSTVALVNSAGGRALLHRPGASQEAFAEPVSFTAELMESCGHFHLANPFSLPWMRVHAGETQRRAREAGMTTSLDTGWDSKGQWLDVIGPCLPHTDLLFANRTEARILSGVDDASEAADFFRGRGVATVVIKLDADGCLVQSGGEEFRVAGYRVPAVDSTGAGDCFVGGYLAARQSGATAREAAQFANAVGALSVQSLGAVAGLRTADETRAWMRSAETQAAG